ncbi:hypothetical protein NMY22_g17030 [Coprinellus aureogranulatus]|nr:hypothetical protein NMY22_g17030 [Coprinellus aureogranulatus]
MPIRGCFPIVEHVLEQFRPQLPACWHIHELSSNLERQRHVSPTITQGGSFCDLRAGDRLLDCDRSRTRFTREIHTPNEILHFHCTDVIRPPSELLPFVPLHPLGAMPAMPPTLPSIYRFRPHSVRPQSLHDDANFRALEPPSFEAHRPRWVIDLRKLSFVLHHLMP